MMAMVHSKILRSRRVASAKARDRFVRDRLSFEQDQMAWYRTLMGLQRNVMDSLWSTHFRKDINPDLHAEHVKVLTEAQSGDVDRDFGGLASVFRARRDKAEKIMDEVYEMRGYVRDADGRWKWPNPSATGAC